MLISTAGNTRRNVALPAIALGTAPNRASAPSRYHRVEFALPDGTPVVAVVRVDLWGCTADVDGLVWMDGKVIDQIACTFRLEGCLETALADTLRRMSTRQRGSGSTSDPT
jgi:hypothetical protein